MFDAATNLLGILVLLGVVFLLTEILGISREYAMLVLLCGSVVRLVNVEVMLKNMQKDASHQGE